MAHRLVTMPFSHFCEKARWALDATGTPYTEEGHVPGMHRFAVRRAGSQSTTSVPLLVTDAGEVLTQSPDIVRFADEAAAPERKLLPVDPGARAQAEALEKRFDDDLGPHIRRFVYFHLLPRRRETFRLFDIQTPRAERLLVRVAFPALRRFMKKMMRIDEAGARKSLDRMDRVFDDVGALLGDGRRYLAGDRFSSADLTFAALSAPLVLPPEHPVIGGSSAIRVDELPAELASAARRLQATPAGAFAARVYRECRHTAPHPH
jgi:glutathione S-transferase